MVISNKFEITFLLAVSHSEQSEESFSLVGWI